MLDIVKLIGDLDEEDGVICRTCPYMVEFRSDEWIIFPSEQLAQQFLALCRARSNEQQEF